MTDLPPDPYWLAEQIVAGEEVNGWSIAARMLAAALVAERNRREADSEGFRGSLSYLEDLNRRVTAAAAAAPGNEEKLRDAVKGWKRRHEEAARNMDELKTAARALSDRIVDRGDDTFTLDYGSRETLAAFREVLNAH